MAISACSGDQEHREYAVPDSLCGTEIDAQKFSAFLPSGEKLTTKASSPTPNSKKCAISVDGELIAQTSQEWWDDMGIQEFARGLTLDSQANQSKDGKYAYSGDQAFGKTAGCTSNEHPSQVLYTAIQFPGSDHRDADSMKEMITAYTKSVQESSAC
ncbi:hypothetical protein [Streptomyces sp. CCM_MD2014]|uniref:hypothetical protein n=1 Tax=Streptomyces sp. CCM_MD2014 TaxID=1561022 RepID=UPI001F2AA481|nr:hypothetical protein [Streptomyces sp. CCM_MD2014]MDA4895827.1 hypothetical protein [Streptomyces sp. MS2A]